MTEPSVIPAAESPTGSATMSPAMADLRAYPRYLYDSVALELGQRVWEIGVGYGTYTEWLRADGKQVLATDVDIDCVTRIAHRFSGDDGVQSAHVDLNQPATVSALAGFHADSVLCFNVLEHIQDDVAALTAIRSAVAPDACLGLIVPAHQHLYGRMDAEAGHFRRYSRGSLHGVLTAAGWRIGRLRYRNLIGAAGWWYHSHCRKSAGLADRSINWQMRQMDVWLPRFARITDPLCGWIAGLSVLAIAYAGPAGDDVTSTAATHSAVN
ncbi:MAG: class I SAM-dependent methyltransferase [Planctomycetaceae bacterium]